VPIVDTIPSLDGVLHGSGQLALGATKCSKSMLPNPTLGLPTLTVYMSFLMWRYMNPSVSWSKPSGEREDVSGFALLSAIKFLGSEVAAQRLASTRVQFAAHDVKFASAKTRDTQRN
jgi:hypothetical protein